ncbi:hypothetical protein QN277_022098 [Acacia crassicarpa]|uniref:Polymerase nucleotidyl transferase domain-containing protein n=1 Tax=Acacia crassicarpa TaxID=499986 RepID=A0AAE1MP69_9FABA|nr:hypothetical protein QN277_022098 [Acacia crassicarpa]
MGEHEGWAQPSGSLLPNGLLPDEAASVIRVLDSERWLKAEERTAELITRIQPNPPSEERRNAVADYVQGLIMKCFPCQVFTFGSVPLKTYLPDGDIDLTAFSKNQNLKDTWAHQVRDMLEIEEENEHAEFHVKEVQYIQAEVKIVKCLVENIVVDISFNQLGGLCTLCFLEEVDNLINQNHLFKRSIILIKAWCYYESRILGAHHGLISTYALETLVLYIFHVFNNSFAGPLEVLYRFLEFFSKFDWDNFCVSLWGPVPISSLPDVTAEPPRKDGGDFLLSKLFLDACSSVYAVSPGGQESQGHTFVSKHFNVIDPVRVNNNLGRSVSKGNFYRIRGAFAFGAKKLARLLDCPKEDLYSEVNQFFMNTWDRHGNGQRPDAPSNDLWRLRLSLHDQLQGSDNLSKNSQNFNITDREYQAEGGHSPRGGPSHHGSSLKSNDASTISHTQNLKAHSNQNNLRTSDQVRREISSDQGASVDEGQKNVKPSNPMVDIQGRFLFARTRSSPELTDSYDEVSSQGRFARAQEGGKGQNSSATLDISRQRNLESDMASSHDVRIDDISATRVSPSHVLDAAADLNSGSNSYHGDSVPGAMGGDFVSVSGTGASQMMLQEEQDLLNLRASSTAHGFSDQAHVRMNLAPGHPPLPFPHAIFASMGYAQRNVGNIPLIDASWGTNMQFPQGLVPSPLTPYSPGIGLTSNREVTIETGSDNFSAVEMSPAEADGDFWHEQERGSVAEVEVDNGILDDKQQSASGSYTFVSSSQVSTSGSSGRNQQKFTKENRGFTIEEHIDTFQRQDGRGNEVCFDDRMASSRLTSAPLSSKSKGSSESSWEGSPTKFSKSTKEKRGRKNIPSVVSTGYGKGKDVSEMSSNLVNDENGERTSLSTTNMAERNTGAPAIASMHVPRHQVPGFEPVQTSGSDSLAPITPVPLGAGSRQRAVDNSGVVPFAFYPTGPPVPFFMLPVYSFPSESGTSYTSRSNFNGEELVDNRDSGQNLDSSEGFEQPEVSSLPNSIRRADFESSEHKSDILNGDFASHWQNLQYGRFCQNSRHPPSMIYPSLVPPVYLHGRFPCDGAGRPLSTNMNLFAQLMDYGPRLVPVAPLQSVLNRPANIYQRFADEMPRYRSGTGTYLPNHRASARDRESANRRGNSNYERSEHHGYREGNWNVNSKMRASGRGHNRFQTERPNSKAERLASGNKREPS